MECQICHNPDSGNHYGALCCRACAAFFRRSILMKLRYRCRKNGSCSLKKETRYCCRFCRMKRCLDLNMVYEDNSEYDVQPETSESSSPLQNGDGAGTSNDFYNIHNIVTHNQLFLSEFKKRLTAVLHKTPPRSTLPYKLTICQQVAVALAHHNDKWPNCSKDGIDLIGRVDFNVMMCEYFQEFEHVAAFCMEIEPFASLSMQQKWLVLKHFAFRFIQLERAFVTSQLLGRDPEDHRVLSWGGQVASYEMAGYDLSTVSNVSEEESKTIFLSSEYKYDKFFVRPFKKINPDQFELFYLLISTMWDLEGQNGIAKETLDISYRVKERVSEELYAYYKFEKNMINFAPRIYKVTSLLSASDRLYEMRVQDGKLSDTFGIYKLDTNFFDL